jgi:hypothetical protein
MNQHLSNVLAALAAASVMTLAMLIGIDALATPAQASPVWAGYYVASLLA